MLAESLVVFWVWLFPWTKGSQSRGACAKGMMAPGLHGASAPAGPGGWKWREAGQGSGDPLFSFLSTADPQRIYTQNIVS